jgi:hypothetical protein
MLAEYMATYLQSDVTQTLLSSMCVCVVCSEALLQAGTPGDRLAQQMINESLSATCIQPTPAVVMTAISAKA